jgi:tripartite-type tricarboxylate transporter receptor subunit TctC
MKFAFASIVIGALGVAAAHDAAAQANTNTTRITRPIRLIVPYVPGGGTDTLSRFVAPAISEEFGQQVVIDNRSGGSSTIGTGIVARAAPDGQTIGMIDAAFLINPSLFANMPYDALKDFTPIVFVASAPLVLIVHPSLNVGTAKELVALAKARAGKLNFGSAGNGSAVHLAAEQLKAAAGVDIQHIPYKGTGQSIADIVGGQLNMIFSTQAVAKPLHVAGRVRAIGITAPKRTTVMPDLATFAEQGLASVDAATINGLLAPAGTPKDYIQRVNGAVQRVLKSRELQTKLDELGFVIAGGSSEEFAQWIRGEIPKWAKVVKSANVKVEGGP